MESAVDHVSRNPAEGFSPKPYYSAEGDSLTFYFLDDESYAERIDDFLTVYKSIETDGLVGCQIKGLAGALELLGDFGLDFYQHDKLKLSLIFFALMAKSESQEKDCYKKLGKIAAQNGFEIEPPPAMLEEDASLTV